MHLWREDLVLKHRQKFGKNKSDALMEVMHLWKVYLWRYDCMYVYINKIRIPVMVGYATPLKHVATINASRAPNF